MKICICCQQEFKPTHHNTQICSVTCKKRKRSEDQRNWRMNNLDQALEKEAAVRRRLQDSGYLTKYRQNRRASKAGYLDRFMERIRENTPDTDVTREALEKVFGDVCSVTGVPFRYSREGQTSFLNPYAPSIDRIDSSQGYYINNLQITLSAVNFAKNQFSMEEFTAVWRDITQSWEALTE